MRRVALPLFGAMVLLALLQGVARAAPDVAVGLGGNEPTTGAVNPLNPQNVIVAKCSLAISTDFGRTFPTTVNVGIPPGYNATGQGCDDVLTFDSQGRLFWAYLLRGDLDNDGTNDDLSVVVQQVNPTTGARVGNAVDITPGAFSDDKPWIAADADPGSPNRDNLYVSWTRGPAIPCSAPGCAVFFSRSTNSGAGFSAPRQISAAGESFVWPSHVAVAPNGDVYASYHSDTCGAATAAMFVLRDSSGGNNLATGAPVQKTSFQSAVTCNVQTAAGAVPQTDFWMQGALAPYVIPDPDRPGALYVIANDDPNNAFGSGDDGDVVLARSTDFGNTWALSTISHAPAGSLQVFPIGAIDQNGRLVVTWYDTRRNQTNAGGNLLLDVFATVSTDGGATFTNDFRVNDTAFDPDLGAPCRFGCGGPGDPPPATRRIGEYNGLAAADGIAYAAWTGNTATGQQVLFDVFSILGAVPDRFEPNDAIQPGVATDLGAHSSYNQPNLTVHSSTDEDFFRVVALNTGKLSVQIASNGRLSDLDVQVRDKFNNAVATSTGAVDTNNTESLTFPAVDGEPYFVRVYASPGAPAAPNQFPPLNVYSLNITNTAAPAPFGLDLAAAADSGRDNADNVTSIAAPTINLRVDSASLSGLALSPTPDSLIADDAPGYKVAVFRDGTLVGYAGQVAGQPGNFTFTFPGSAPLDEGVNAITARVVIVDPSDDPAVPGTVHVTGQGAESAILAVTLDTAAPSPAPAPDLLASSDSGGVDDDNITTVTTPKFAGTGEPNTIVRLFANGVAVGQGTMSSQGAYEITVNPLADGVYAVTARLEDLAGNLSAPSAALKVTIASASLTLPGATASGGPAGPVQVDLANGTIAGYPGIAGVTGNIGVIGIPTVNLDVNNHDLTIIGTPGDDGLRYTPTGAKAGILTRDGSAQTISFSNVGGTFTIDPAAGSDTVTALGTAGGDTITATVDTATTVRVNALLTVRVPIVNVEKLAISAAQGIDTVNVTAFDSVNASLFVDGGEPTANTPNADLLGVFAGSAKARVQQMPGGPTPGSGSVTVSYPQTTGNQTRVDYTAVERVKTTK
jgi:Bacterial Ig-like domain/Bacterial pre-peptidase C-terminal domain